jgi:hypothetical protein
MTTAVDLHSGDALIIVRTSRARLAKSGPYQFAGCSNSFCARQFSNSAT